MIAVMCSVNNITWLLFNKHIFYFACFHFFNTWHPFRFSKFSIKTEALIVFLKLSMLEIHISNEGIQVGDEEKHVGDEENHVSDKEKHISDEEEHVGNKQKHIGDEEKHIGEEQKYFGNNKL